MITSGAVTKRVDRLERAGLVARSRHAEDARSRLVGLTPDGLALVDRLFEQHMANEHRLVAGSHAPPSDVSSPHLLEKLGPPARR